MVLGDDDTPKRSGSKRQLTLSKTPPPTTIKVSWSSLADVVEFIKNIKDWGLWHKHTELAAGVEYYRCKLVDGTTLVAEEQDDKVLYHMIPKGGKYNIVPDSFDDVLLHIILLAEALDEKACCAEITTARGIALEEYKLTYRSEVEHRNWSHDGGNW